MATDRARERAMANLDPTSGRRTTISDPMNDHDLYVRLLLQNQARLLRFILHFLPNKDEAEDVLQDVSLIIWKKWGEYQSDRDFYRWATGVARLEIWNRLRRNARLGVLLDEAQLDGIADRVVEATSDSEQLELRIDALRKCVKELRNSDRELIRLRYASDFNTKEFAESINASANSIYKMLGRIRRQLHGCVERRIRIEMHGV